MKCIAAGGVGAAELTGMCVTVEGSGCGDNLHELHCQVACSRGAVCSDEGYDCAARMVVLSGDVSSCYNGREVFRDCRLGALGEGR